MPGTEAPSMTKRATGLTAKLPPRAGESDGKNLGPKRLD